MDRIGVRNLTVKEPPPLAASTRPTKALRLIDEVLAVEVPRSAFLSGDGSVIYALRDRLLDAGVDRDNIRLGGVFSIIPSGRHSPDNTVVRRRKTDGNTSNQNLHERRR